MFWMSLYNLVEFNSESGYIYHGRSNYSSKVVNFLSLKNNLSNSHADHGEFQRDTCSWKGQLERTTSWKVLSWKVWSWNVSLKLERAKRSWKEPSEVGKIRAKLERADRSWKVSFEVGKFWLKLESLKISSFQHQRNFPTPNFPT